MADTVSQIQTTLSTGVASSIDGITTLTPLQRSTLNDAADKLSTEYAPRLLDQVNSNANYQLTNISQEAYGPNNPVDLVNKNLSSTEVANILNPVVNTPLSSELTNSFVGDLTNRLSTTLNENQLSGLDLNNLSSALKNTVSGLMDTGLGTALQSFTQQLMSGSSAVTPFFSSVNNLFESGSDPALIKIDEAISAAVAGKALANSKSFEINSRENEEKISATRKGFVDPTATYPTKEYANRPETNKLATGDIRGTVVQHKEKNRMLGAQLPNGESWDQPLSPFKGEYPYNKVIQTESGHIIEMDDTPGSERLHVYHRSGTYIEIDANGSVVKRTKGSSYEIIDKNNYVAINGRTNVSVNGACQIFVGADANIEVEGDTNIICKNDITAQAGGRIDLSATEEINIRSKIVRIESDEAMHLSSDLKIDVQSTTFNQKVSETVSTSTTDFNISLGGQFNLNASGSVDIDGSEIQLNGGTSSAVEVEDSENAKIGLLAGRKDIGEVIIADPVALNYMDYSNTIAEDSGDSTLAKQNQDQLIRDGVASQEEVSEYVIASESNTPRSTQTETVIPSVELLKVTNLPDNYQLSKHFTVGMLTVQTAASKQKLQSQVGLSYGEIAYNLQALALNVLEPIKALYPNFVITSCL